MAYNLKDNRNLYLNQGLVFPLRESLSKQILESGEGKHAKLLKICVRACMCVYGIGSCDYGD